MWILSTFTRAFVFAHNMNDFNSHKNSTQNVNKICFFSLFWVEIIKKIRQDLLKNENF